MALDGFGGFTQAVSAPVRRALLELRREIAQIVAGEIDLTQVRISSAADASLSSTDHGLQIGPTGGTNMAFDGNEILARNNGAASIVYINNDDGARAEVGAGGLHVRGDITGVWDDTHSNPAMSSGWTLDAFSAWRCGDLIQWSVYFTRSGSAITVPSDGDVGNTSVCTLPASLRGAITGQLACDGVVATGPVVGATFRPSTGEVLLVAISDDATIATSETFSVGGMHYVG